MGDIFDGYVKRCHNFWKDNGNKLQAITNKKVEDDDPDPGFEIAVFNGPEEGKTYGEKVEEQESGLLIVGCNPSGIAKHKDFRKQSDELTDFYIVNTFPLDKSEDRYTMAIKEFAEKCNYSKNYYKMDVFGIMRLQQSVISDDIKKKRCKHVDQYKELFRIFVETVIELKPEKIVFANAFISNLIQGEDDVYERIRNGYVEVAKERDDKGGLTITFKCNNKTWESKAWFSSMLSGQRALDNGSKELLIWAVRRPEDAN